MSALKNRERAYRIMIKLLRYMRGHIKESILSPTFKLLEASFELFVPLVVAKIIDSGIGSGDTGYVIKMCLVLALLSFVGLAASVLGQLYAARASVGFASKIRHAMFSKIQSMPFSELDRIGTSTLITRMTSDIGQVQTGVNLTLRLILRAPFIVFGAMIMAFTVDAASASVFAVMIPALSVVVFGIMIISIPLYRKVQSSLDRVTLHTRENLTGVRILRGFCKERDETESFEKASDELKKCQKFVGRISALMNPVTYVIVNISVIYLIHIGALRVNSGYISRGELVAMYNYMTQILTELIKLANLIITVTKSAACAGRISSILEESPSERTSGYECVTSVGGKAPKVEFRNVSFKYDGNSENSLSDISFSVYPGETVGIIGATGSGKTTLVNLIPAFYECTDGEVLVDGKNVKELSLNSLRQKFGIVPQKAVLFRGTIRENLKFRDAEASDEEIMSAAKTAQAKSVIERKKGALDGFVDQSGRNFSGGQRQRLTIARALVGDPDILILDDSSSALDYATDSALRSSLAELPYKHTTFIVSQRTSSIMGADRIIVLENGRAVGIGTHEELYQSCAAYREIHDLQFREKKKTHGAGAKSEGRGRHVYEQ